MAQLKRRSHGAVRGALALGFLVAIFPGTRASAGPTSHETSRRAADRQSDISTAPLIIADEQSDSFDDPQDFDFIVLLPAMGRKIRPVLGLGCLELAALRTSDRHRRWWGSGSDPPPA